MLQLQKGHRRARRGRRRARLPLQRHTMGQSNQECKETSESNVLAM